MQRGDLEGKRVRIVLNRDGGTLKTTDARDVLTLVEGAFARAGAEVGGAIVSGPEIVEALEAAARNPDVDVLVAGGGDGTVSAAAGSAWRHGKALGVLPAGTMNLFARALGLPMDLDAAVAALAFAEIRAVDIATANGAPFVHQYSLGMQPRMILLRERFDHGGRLAKIWASARSTARVLARPGRVVAACEVDGEASAGRYGFLVVANNLYGEGHMPYAGDPAGGALAVCRAPRLKFWGNARLAFDLMRGRWRDAAMLDVETGGTVRLKLSGRIRPKRASLDGELVPVEPEVEIQIHPGALKALTPVYANRSSAP